MVEHVFGNEFYGLFGLLLGQLGEGLEQQWHQLLVKVGLDWQLLDFGYLQRC